MSDLMMKDDADQQDSPNVEGSSGGNHAWWGVALCLMAIAGLGYYTYASQSQLKQSLTTAQQQAGELTQQLQVLEKDNASVSANLQHAVDRLGATAEELASTRKATDSLRQAQTKTAQDTKTNAEAVQSAREEANGQVTEVNGRVTTVSNDVKAVAADLVTARHDLDDNRRKIGASADQIAKNGTDLANLRRQSERDIIPFDIRKNSSPETWTVAGIRIELKKTDVQRSKYSAVLHVDDRLLEKKDRTANEPVPIIVGPNRQRYEIVVNTVERDRIRGYVSVPKGALSASNSLPVAGS